MPHYYAKIWIHLVYATKRREISIDPEIEQQVYQNIDHELHLLGCGLKIINGMPDHLHVLFLNNPRHALSAIVQQLKGSTSRWINDQKLCADHFSWQTGYAAFSVSESKLDVVYNYILNQKSHHQTMSFEEELDQLRVWHNLG